jgi:hypothetical protein
MSASQPGLPIEPVWRFYRREVPAALHKYVKYFKLWMTIERLRRRVRNDPARASYQDQALAPVEAGDTETLELFTHNEAARSAVQHARRIKQLTAKAAAV